MSVIPEFIFKSALQRGFETFRSDARLIEQLFRNFTLQSIHENVRLFTDELIQVEVNYPIDAPKLPCIVILLKSESESESFLNDYAGSGTPDEFSYYGDLDSEILGGVGSLATMSGEPTLVYGPHNVVTSTNNTVYIGTKEFQIGELVGEEKDYTLRVVAGKGKGQQRKISGNGTNFVMVSQNWNTNPDSTSIFEIVAPPTEVFGEPSKIYDRRDPTLALERRSILYRATCLFNIIGRNPEETVVISTVVKAILMALRMTLEEQGIKSMKVSGTDLMSRPDFLPTLAFIRSLNVEFLYEFDIFENLGPLIEQININFENAGVEIQSTEAMLTTQED